MLHASCSRSCLSFVHSFFARPAAIQIQAAAAVAVAVDWTRLLSSRLVFLIINNLWSPPSPTASLAFLFVFQFCLAVHSHLSRKLRCRAYFFLSQGLYRLSQDLYQRFWCCLVEVKMQVWAPSSRAGRSIP